MKKIVLFVLLLQLVLLFGCQANQPAESITLSDLQIQACNSADEAGTCNSRLPEVGIILAEDCCEALGKCCR